MTKRISEKDSMLNRLNIQIREIEQKHHQQSFQGACPVRPAWQHL